MEESEIIDKYLRGELDAEQSEKFETNLKSNATLQKKVTLRKLIIAGISQSYTEELKSKLADFDRSLENKKRFEFNWKMAAVFAVLVISASIFYLLIQKSSPYDYDIVELGLPNSMGANDNIDLSNAMNTFKTGDYEAASQIFEELLAHKPSSDTLLYFSGLADFRTKQTKAAIQKWGQIEATSKFFSKTNYRLAIAYWSNGDEKRAKELLQKIVDSENDSLQMEAKQALDALQ